MPEGGNEQLFMNLSDDLERLTTRFSGTRERILVSSRERLNKGTKESTKSLTLYCHRIKNKTL